MGPVGCPPDQGAVPYLRGSCREGRRGSATIPGLNVLPLSPYPSIQLGLLPLASPWKKFRRKGGRKKINHAAEKRQPRSAGGSSEPGGPVYLRHWRPVSTPPHPIPPPPGPALAIHHSVPRQCPSGPAPRRRAPRPAELRFHPGGREGVRRGGPGGRAGGQGTWGNQGPASAGLVLSSDLTATPHSPRWLRRSGQEDLTELL